MSSSRYGLQIRAATGADAAGLAELMQACGYPADASPDALGRRLETLRAQDGAVLLASAWGPPSGVVALDWFGALDSDRPVARITTLLVAPDERRGGIGRALLKGAAQAARQAGCGTLQVQALPGHESIEAFCRQTGFETAGTLYARQLRKRTGPEA